MNMEGGEGSVPEPSSHIPQALHQQTSQHAYHHSLASPSPASSSSCYGGGGGQACGGSHYHGDYVPFIPSQHWLSGSSGVLSHNPSSSSTSSASAANLESNNGYNGSVNANAFPSFGYASSSGGSGEPMGNVFGYNGSGGGGSPHSNNNNGGGGGTTVSSSGSTIHYPGSQQGLLLGLFSSNNSSGNNNNNDPLRSFPPPSVAGPYSGSPMNCSVVGSGSNMGLYHHHRIPPSSSSLPYNCIPGPNAYHHHHHHHEMQHLIPTPYSRPLHHPHHQPQQHSTSSRRHDSSKGQSKASTSSSGNNSNNSPRMPWCTSNCPPGEPAPYPGGLEVVWRELPLECQRLMSMKDIPDSAKMRGYFTVCELLILKRNLLGRMANEQPLLCGEGEVGYAKDDALNTAAIVDESGPSQGSPAEGELEHAQYHHSQHQHQMMMDPSSSSSSVVKEGPKLVILKCSSGAEHQGEEVEEEEEEDEEQEDERHRMETRQCHPLPAASSSSNSLQALSCAITAASVAVDAKDGLDLTPSSSEPKVEEGLGNSNSQCLESAGGRPVPPYITPAPAYRTVTLVFKLLQIGNYHIRSYSEINPNRLRVLFNTQRLTYECHLTLVRASEKEGSGEGGGPGNVRKLLTVDIGFDQISMIKFDYNKLFLKVDGSPLLSVSYYPAEQDNTCPPLTPHDLLLLEQIDKGQLKLNPCHQIYFINDRLVHLLENQFNQHPRFRQIIQQTHDAFNM